MYQPSEIESTNVLGVYRTIYKNFSETRFNTWPGLEGFIDRLHENSTGFEIGFGNGKNMRYAKNKGHRSGFRCNQLAKEIADQFAVFVPTLTTIITNKENKNNPTKISGNHRMSKGEFEIYKVIKSCVRLKVNDIY